MDNKNHMVFSYTFGAVCIILLPTSYLHNFHFPTCTIVIGTVCIILVGTVCIILVVAHSA